MNSWRSWCRCARPVAGRGVTRSRVAAAVAAVTMCSVLFSIPTSASAQPTTTTTPVAGSSTPTTTTVAGGSSTTTTAPARQHVLNQPNLNALSPHIEMLSGSGVNYQYSSGAGSPSVGPGVPTFMSSPGGPYIYDSHGRVVILHGVNVVYKHAPYIAYPDPGQAVELRQLRRVAHAERWGSTWCGSASSGRRSNRGRGGRTNRTFARPARPAIPTSSTRRSH